MKTDPPPKADAVIRTVQLVSGERGKVEHLRLHYAIFDGEAYLPSITVGMPQAEALPLAERGEVDFIHGPEGVCLFSAKWLAAARPERTDVLRIRKILLDETAAAAFAAGPNQ